MTDRPSQKRQRGASERLDLQPAAQAEGFGSFELDLKTGDAHYSEGLRRILAVPEELALTRELFFERIHSEDREIVDRAFEGARGDGEALSFEIRVTRFDGVERVVRARGVTIPAGRRDSAKVSGTIQDVTAEVAASSARDLLSYVVQSTGDAIITKAPDGTITSWSRSAEEAIGRPSGITESPDRAGEWQKLLQTVFSGQSIEDFQTERVRKDGRVIAVSLTVSPVTDANGRIVQCAIIARDMTERVRYEERLRHMADHDQLTGLYNRRRFDEELKREL